MSDAATRMASAVFAKTAQGQAEIQTRSLGLAPLVRRLLVLVDGRRSVAELQAFVAGADVSALLDELLLKRCIHATLVPPPASAPLPPAEPSPPTAPSRPMDFQPSVAPASVTAWNSLPPPESRSEKEVEMARHFMINTINTMLEQNTRLTLVEKIFNSRDAAELRNHVGDWEEAIGSSWIGRRRLGALRKKLYEVL